MRICWTGYNSLRRDVMAPRGAVDQYYTVIPALHHLSGEYVHWIQFKHLQPGAETPDPNVAEEDELEVHRHVVHYGDMMAPVSKWVNGLPVVGRWQASNVPAEEFNLKYGFPEVDVVIFEATGQLNSAYCLDWILRQLYKKNPNLGFLLFDQDICSATVLSKMKKWHHDPFSRVIRLSHHFGWLADTAQAVALSPHLSYRNQSPVSGISGIAYVGNDYKRREPMLRLMQGPNFHHYGIVKKDFADQFAANRVRLHGKFVPSKAFNIEALYRQHGAGVRCLREDAYRWNLIAVRLSEIARAGCVAFTDRKLQIGKVLSGAYCWVNDAREIVTKAHELNDNPNFLQETIAYQQQAMGYYTSSERYIDAIWTAACRVHQGPVTQDYRLNRYQDLMRASGVMPWGHN